MIISPQKSRIKVISHEESDGRLKEIYDDLIKSREMTLDPGEATDNDLTTPLKEKEHSDETILDASLVVSYFNFVNRMVLDLDVHLENHAGAGFKY